MKEISNKKKVDIIFCGLVRTPDLLTRSISEMTELRKKGLVDRIIFSTWRGEVQKYPEIYRFLKKNKVEILENEEPTGDSGIASIVYQMKALEMGLNYVRDKKFIFKSRADMYVNKEFLRKLFSKKMELLKIRKDLPKRNIFKYKIWVHFFELKIPFLIGDSAFFGYSEDLKKLVNYDKSYDTRFRLTAVSHMEHIRRFIHPFLNDYPILKDTVKEHVKIGYLRSIVLRILLNIFSLKFLKLKKIRIIDILNKQNNYRILKNKLKDDSFLESLAAYYLILYSHFYVNGNSMKNQIILKGFVDPGRWMIDSTNFDNNFSKKSIFKMGWNQGYVYDMKFLDNLFNGKLEKTEFSEKLSAAIKSFFETTH